MVLLFVVCCLLNLNLPFQKKKFQLGTYVDSLNFDGKEEETETMESTMIMFDDDESCCTVRITLAMGKGEDAKTKQLKPMDPKKFMVSEIISMLETNRHILPRRWRMQRLYYYSTRMKGN